MDNINIDSGNNINLSVITENNTNKLKVESQNLYESYTNSLPNDTLISYGQSEPGKNGFNPTNCKIYIQYEN